MVQQFLVLTARIWGQNFGFVASIASYLVSFPSLCEGARAAFEPLGRWVSKVHVQFCLQVTRTNAVISAWKCAFPEGWDGWDSKESNHREADHRRARRNWCFQVWPTDLTRILIWIRLDLWIDFTFWRFSRFKSMGYDVWYSLHSIHLCWGHTGWGSMNSSMKFGNGRCSPRCLWTSQTRSLDVVSYPDISRLPTTFSFRVFFVFPLFPPSSNVWSHHGWISRSQQTCTFSSTFLKVAGARIAIVLNSILHHREAIRWLFWKITGADSFWMLWNALRLPWHFRFMSLWHVVAYCKHCHVVSRFDGHSFFWSLTKSCSGPAARWHGRQPPGRWGGRRGQTLGHPFKHSMHTFKACLDILI